MGLGSQRVESPDGGVAERLHLLMIAAQFVENTLRQGENLRFGIFRETNIYDQFRAFFNNIFEEDQFS